MEPNPFRNASQVVSDPYRVATSSVAGLGWALGWGAAEYWRRYSAQCSATYRFPASFFSDLRESILLVPSDFIVFIAVATAFTALRLHLTKHVFLPLAVWLETPAAVVARVPENMFKGCFYLFTTSLIFHITSSSAYAYVWNDPLALFERWRPDTLVPWKIYVLYMVEIGFYLHSLYGSIFLDSSRKDAAVMMIHHGATLILLTFSYGSRHHMEGMLVLSCHDVCDVFLETWKLNSALRRRAGGRFFALHDAVANVAFVGFVCSWAVFRIYWYPLKVLYASLYGPVAMGLVPIHMPFYPMYSTLLVLLFAMNVYWFGLVLVGLHKYAKGTLKEIDDTREYSVPEGLNKKGEVAETTSPDGAKKDM